VSRDGVAKPVHAPGCSWQDRQDRQRLPASRHRHDIRRASGTDVAE